MKSGLGTRKNHLLLGSASPEERGSTIQSGSGPRLGSFPWSDSTGEKEKKMGVAVHGSPSKEGGNISSATTMEEKRRVA